jgi:hypothetical protein
MSVDMDLSEAGMSLHYGINNGKVVLMVADAKGPLHRVSMTPEEWIQITNDIPAMGEGDVKVIDGHQQMR